MEWSEVRQGRTKGKGGYGRVKGGYGRVHWRGGEGG